MVDNAAVKKVDAEELKVIDKLARAVGAQVVFEEEPIIVPSQYHFNTEKRAETWI